MLAGVPVMAGQQPAATPQPPPPAQPVGQAAPRCADDGEGGACVWGRVEGFDGGSVQLRGLKVVLAGITAPSYRDFCGNRNSKEEFDCGRPARKRMADLVAKGVACEIVEVSGAQLWGRCRGVDGDLGRLLVQSGVVRAAKDGPYAEAQKQAVAAKKGLWAADTILPKDWETARRKAEDDE